ncbi:MULTISPECIES: amidase [unclassified Amycolatopsis]|uniref:amidase n=1 Tax=unclassified Amycolatopsis TaxID=2618356 RepID=UPI00106E3551|nr:MULTISPECIES: amidase [unclassified Amycolatopsis]
MTDLSFATATELAAMIRTRELSPLELMRHTLDRVASINGDLNAVVSLDPQRALDEATALTDRLAHGADPGPLAGIPIAVKDLEDAEGFPTTRGTKAFRDAPPAASDSVHVARLRAAGAIVIGKTNAPPMGAAIATHNEAFGITRNPWNLDKSPGGSSGGAAAAVAAGLVSLATAGDGGGSTRIPAALCGIVGFKPTRGRIPHGPAAIPSWTQHSCLTPMTRTVRDAALHLDLAAGFDPADPYSLPRPVESYVDGLEQRPPALRIVVHRTFGVAEPELAVLHAVDRTIEVLRELGHAVVEDEIAHPHAEDFLTAVQLRQKVLAYQRFAAVAEEFAAHRDRFEPWFADLLDHGSSVTTAELSRYWEYRGQLDRWAAGLFDRCDLLLTPTTPTTAWPAEGPDVQRRTIPIAFTAPFNDTGNPAISVPTGLSPDGLPCAVQLVAPHHRDDLLLRVAADLEQVLGALRPGITARR